MNQRIFWHLVGRIIAIGVVAGLLLALLGWPAKLVWYRGVIVGGFVSVAIGLMGFWAYLMLNFLVRSFLPLRVWIWFQGMLVVVAVLDVAYYFPQLISSLPTGLTLPPGNYLPFILAPLVLGAVVAFFKARLSGKNAFVPALFFMYVFTGVEWVPALINAKEWGPAGLIWVILFLCNTYLILVLGRIGSRQPAAISA